MSQSSLSPLEAPNHVRVVQSRPKPQCWDHGCNGRQFSTFSNLLRHQREKSGVATKSSCPNCGAEFTRTTARNGHMAHEKCKQRRNSWAGMAVLAPLSFWCGGAFHANFLFTGCAAQGVGCFVLRSRLFFALPYLGWVLDAIRLDQLVTRKKNGRM